MAGANGEGAGKGEGIAPALNSSRHCERARDVAETRAKEATELGKARGYPLFFTTEPEE